jgi:hypothetical protein
MELKSASFGGEGGEIAEYVLNTMVFKQGNWKQIVERKISGWGEIGEAIAGEISEIRSKVFLHKSI